ncbi:alkaline phosphatase family protein [Gillisia sp. M10.2A]|uniref:Alkaline phosphatase family protein n=1 Tax=Gillisia lutea TaxID=2909668 RepID=A0ABS9EER9_9FLAO|nr:alkaline phosphatase D family protein [Gillisia lutea]MCF4101363.1 alkaline phosphatase family protein [Gillisia lutea]
MKQFFSLSLCLFLFISCGNIKESANKEGKPLDETADFTLAFGSCNKPELPQPLWAAMQKDEPDVFIWGGDIVYASSRDMKAMKDDYKKQNATPGYKKLKKNTEIMATWDDHDYGLNDGGVEWERKKESQQLFLDFMEVKNTDARRKQHGVYNSKLFTTPNGSVKVIVLDTRYFRSPLRKSDDPNKRYEPTNSGTMLGKPQWEWLKAELSNSSADFNVIVSSIQVLSYEHGFETWGNFPHEVEKLKTTIVNSKAKNVILLSGDRHISEISETEVEGLNYPLIDFTSSGMTHTYSEYSEEPNKYRKSKVVNELSFGLLLFDFNKKQVKMQMRGTTNRVQEELVQVYK